MIYTRKFFHNFRVQINNINMENAVGINSNRERKYLLASGLTVGVYN